jgi:hypothetical protein
MGETMGKLLKDKFTKCHPREFRAVWTAITGSILDLLSEGFIYKHEKGKTRWGICEFLKVLVPFLITYSVEVNCACNQSCHIVPKNMTPSILRAEQDVWLTLVDIMGGDVNNNDIPLPHFLSLVNRDPNSLEYNLHDEEASTSSLGSVGFSATGVMAKVSAVKDMEIPVELRRWKNPDFKVCTNSTEVYIFKP